MLLGSVLQIKKKTSHLKGTMPEKVNFSRISVILNKALWRI
jgi:hypothetical protein